MRPEILTHPNIPKPLHGTAPRNILGSGWWNKQRKAAYARYDYRCACCGTEKKNAPRHILEAHESYEIDYKTGTVRLNEIVALCRYCHMFIHSGRLYALYDGKKLGRQNALFILERGFGILSQAGLRPFAGTVISYLMIRFNIDEAKARELAKEKGYVLPESKVSWREWKLVLDGKEYGSRFRDENEWREHYTSRE